MKLKIEVVQNTCDVKGLSKWGGEIMLVLKDGKVVHHHDYSDGMVELDYLPDIFAPFGVEVEFETVEPKGKLLKTCQEYMENQYGPAEY
jgi:hypothetical protein